MLYIFVYKLKKNNKKIIILNNFAFMKHHNKNFSLRIVKYYF